MQVKKTRPLCSMGRIFRCARNEFALFSDIIDGSFGIGCSAGGRLAAPLGKPQTESVRESAGRVATALLATGWEVLQDI
jgi:hypothetical protein